MKSRVFRFLRAVLVLVVVIFLLLAGAILALNLFGQNLIRGQIESEAFRAMISREVSKAIKVEGEFGPIRYLGDWRAATEGYSSTGLPGQAVAGLDATDVEARFDPWGVLEGVWRLDSIHIREGTFKLREPDDALKQPMPEGKRPWYAVFMPERFDCRWIQCPNARVEFPFMGQTGALFDLKLGATMIGRNFKYFGSEGRLEFPGLPEMIVDAVEVYVTREVVDIGYGYLRIPDTDGRVELSGRLGQHEDKSITAKVKLESVDVARLLPEAWKGDLTGILSAELEYATDKTGGDARGKGNARLGRGEVSGIEALDALARERRNPDLRRVTYDAVKLNYELADGTLSVRELELLTDDAVIRGEGDWTFKSQAFALRLRFERMPLSMWFPEVLTHGIRGTIEGGAEWNWVAGDFGDGDGKGRLDLQNGQLEGFQFQKFLARFLKDDEYSEMEVPTAELQWHHTTKGTRLENINILSPGKAGLRGEVFIGGDDALDGTLLVGASASALTWLPDATTTVFNEQSDDLHWARVRLTGTLEHPQTDFVHQVMAQLERHPLALAELAARGLSWWLGDLLHTAPQSD